MSFDTSHLFHGSQVLPLQAQIWHEHGSRHDSWGYLKSPDGSSAYPQHPSMSCYNSASTQFEHTADQILSQKLYLSPVSDDTIDIQARKHKKVRAMQACEQCRVRKQRCDEGSPCKFCKDVGLDCKYRPAMHTRVDQTFEVMLTRAAAHAEAIQRLVERVDCLARSTGPFEYQGNTAPPPDFSWPTTEESYPIVAPQDLTSERVTPPSTVPSRDTDAALTNALTWSKVGKVFAACGIEIDDDYLVTAEERPILQLRAMWDLQPGQRYEEGPAILEWIKGIQTGGSDRLTIKSLYAAFCQNVLHLQPFLSSQRIKRLLETFVSTYGSGTHSQGGPNRSGNDVDRVGSLKRKHGTYAHPGHRVDCAPNNAIVLLMLALGDTALKVDAGLGADTIVHADTGLGDFGNTPGLPYYTKAVDLMAGHMDGDDLVHAQMFLLAGLYKAQLCRIREASSWYFMAGRVLLRLLDRHLLIAKKYNADNKPSSGGGKSASTATPSVLPPRERLIVLAAWACLRFESEITPKLCLPLSGLEHIKQRLPVPEHLLAENITTDNNTYLGSMSELAALEAGRLQKLNSMAREDFRSGDNVNSSPERLRVMMKSHIAALGEWRMSLPEKLRWTDQAPPPNCNVTASFRRSYWEAKVALLRPYLYYALHVLPDTQHAENICLPAEVDRDIKFAHDAQIFAAVHASMMKYGKSEILRMSALCIEAAKHSILAFDGIKGNLVLTNIPSVAHGQFMNVLLLTAAHRDNGVRRFISASELKRFMDKTIEFTQRFASLSPTCAADCALLLRIRKTLFGQPEAFAV